MTADKAQAASVGVINIDIGVNVRSGPGTDYDIIGGISYGSSVTITGLQRTDRLYKRRLCDHKL